jgi:hypothetical protein
LFAEYITIADALLIEESQFSPSSEHAVIAVKSDYPQAKIEKLSSDVAGENGLSDKSYPSSSATSEVKPFLFLMRPFAL